jgi:integrase
LGLRQLGRQHFAHLSAIAQGVAIERSALTYLGVNHAHAAPAAHRLVVDSARALARRQGEKDWRLVGLHIRAVAAQDRPSLDEFVDRAGLNPDVWSEQDLLGFYEEAYPAVDAGVSTRTLAQRRERSRQRQFALLTRLACQAGTDAQPSDRIDTWFDPTVAKRLQASGLLLLQDLRALIGRGGNWWRKLPATGEAKARRIAEFLAILLPGSLPAAPSFALDELAGGHPVPPSPALVPEARSTDGQGSLDLVVGAPTLPALQVHSDREAVKRWVEARAGSESTAKRYTTEALRLLLWLQSVRRLPLAAMGADDCRAYMVFLEHLPAEWIGQRKASPFTPGWTPCRGPLSVASRRHTITILSAMCDWLASVRYLSVNPWRLINRRIGDERGRSQLDTRAFTPQAWAEILRVLNDQAPSPAVNRLRFVLQFVEATGLRSAELIGARLGDLQDHEEGLILKVQGKGARNRDVSVPSQAEAALDAYLQSRHFDVWHECDAALPLLSRTTEVTEPITYDALYKAIKVGLRRAILASDLSGPAKERALRASPHWLRHTFGTRATERGVPADVIQAQMGHADPATTAQYSRAQIKRRMGALEGAFGVERPAK